MHKKWMNISGLYANCQVMECYVMESDVIHLSCHLPACFHTVMSHAPAFYCRGRILGPFKLFLNYRALVACFYHSLGSTVVYSTIGIYHTIILHSTGTTDINPCLSLGLSCILETKDRDRPSLPSSAKDSLDS